jgi:hypothetical protein
VAGQLLAAAAAQVGGQDALVAEQPADPVRDGVGRLARVEHEHPPARAAEHQRGAQTGGATADDHGVHDRRAGAVVRVAALAGSCCRVGAGDHVSRTGSWRATNRREEHCLPPGITAM